MQCVSHWWLAIDRLASWTNDLCYHKYLKLTFASYVWNKHKTLFNVDQSTLIIAQSLDWKSKNTDCLDYFESPTKLLKSNVKEPMHKGFCSDVYDGLYLLQVRKYTCHHFLLCLASQMSHLSSVWFAACPRGNWIILLIRGGILTS